MINEKDNIAELIIIKFRNAKDGIEGVYSPENLLQVIDAMRMHDDLQEGKCLSYIQKKVDSGVDLTDEEIEEIYSTLTLHQNITLIAEDGSIVLEEM